MRIAILLLVLMSPLTTLANTKKLEECRATYEHFFPHCDAISPNLSECVISSLRGLYLRDVVMYRPQDGDPSPSTYGRYKLTQEYRLRLQDLLADRKAIVGATLCLPSDERWERSKDGKFTSARKDLSFLSAENYFKKFRAEVSISSGVMDLQESHSEKLYFFRVISFFRKTHPVKTAITHVAFCEAVDGFDCTDAFFFRVGRRGTIF